MRRMSNRRRTKGARWTVTVFWNCSLKTVFFDNSPLFFAFFLWGIIHFSSLFCCFSSLIASLNNFRHSQTHKIVHIYHVGFTFLSIIGSLRQPAGCSRDFSTWAGSQFWHEPWHPRARLRLQDDRWSRRLHHDPLHRVRFLPPFLF